MKLAGERFVMMHSSMTVFLSFSAFTPIYRYNSSNDLVSAIYCFVFPSKANTPEVRGFRSFQPHTLCPELCFLLQAIRRCVPRA